MTSIQRVYALACEAAMRHGDVVRLGEKTLVREGKVFWLVSATGWVILALTPAGGWHLTDGREFDELEELLASAA